MANVEELDELQGAALIYGIYDEYATLVSKAYGVRGISYPRMKELMQDMDVLEGVPGTLVDAFVREHLQRADMDGNGVISAPDFVVWLLTEVAALVPIRDAFCSVTGLRPLYNQYHAVVLGDVGFSDGSRRPATGVQSWAFLKMVEQYGVSASSEAARQAFKAARATIGASRGASGGNTGGTSIDGTGGGRLQFAAFVRALSLLASRKMSSQDVVLYSVVSCGQPPPTALAAGSGTAAASGGRRAALPAGVAAVGLGSLLEGPVSKEAYRCGNCGQQHARWRLQDWLKLESHLLSVGVPQPVRRHMPALPLLNSRNLRAVFHRYNAAHNRGRLPPPSYRLPVAGGKPPPMQQGNGHDGDYRHHRHHTPDDNWDSGGGGGCAQPAAFGACCCLFRSLSVMEMSAWLRLCGDCDTIRHSIAAHGSGLTPAKLEAAFTAAASVAGAYLADDSAGIHDVPTTGAGAAAAAGGGGGKLSLQRNRLGAVAGSDTRAASDRAPKRSTAAYQAPLDGHPPRLHEVRGPASAAAWLANARALPSANPYSGGGGSGGSGGAARQGGQGPPHGQQHRPARLVLTFPQFLEALRLVAEEAGGHPTTTALAEQYLLRICADIAAEGCPRPDPTTLAGTAQIRRQQHQLHHGGEGGGEAGDDGGDGDCNSRYGSLPQSRHRQDEEEVTSASTSTKYSYGDFTPPESNLYTSANSSRMGGSVTSQRLPAQKRLPAVSGGDTPETSLKSPQHSSSTGRALPPAAVSRAASMTSTSTSTKYSYGDFTPPESDLYTSASSSRVGSASSRRPSSRSAAPPPDPALASTAAPAASTASGRPVPNADVGSRLTQPHPAPQTQQRRLGAQPGMPAPPSAWSKPPPPPPLAAPAAAPGRTRPVSAPRTRPSAASNAGGKGGDFSGGERHPGPDGPAGSAGSAATTSAPGAGAGASRPRPPSAKVRVAPSVSPHGGVGGDGGCSGDAVAGGSTSRPMSALRARTRSTGGGEGDGPATAAVAAGAAAGGHEGDPGHTGGGGGGGPKLAFGRSLPRPEDAPSPLVPRLNLQALAAPGADAGAVPHSTGATSGRHAVGELSSARAGGVSGGGARGSTKRRATGSPRQQQQPLAPAATATAAADGDPTPPADAPSSARPPPSGPSEREPSGAGGSGSHRSSGGESRRPIIGFVSPMRSRRPSEVGAGAAAGSGARLGPSHCSRSTTPTRPSPAESAAGAATTPAPSMSDRRHSEAGSSAPPTSSSVRAAGRATPPPMLPEPPGEALAAARTAAAAVDPRHGDGGSARSLVRCGSGLRNTMLLLARDPSTDGGAVGPDPQLRAPSDAASDGAWRKGPPLRRGTAVPSQPPSREASSVFSELMQQHVVDSGAGTGDGGADMAQSRRASGDWLRPHGRSGRPGPPPPPDPRASPAAVAPAAVPLHPYAGALTPRRVSGNGSVGAANPGRPPLPPSASPQVQHASSPARAPSHMAVLEAPVEADYVPAAQQQQLRRSLSCASSTGGRSPGGDEDGRGSGSGAEGGGVMAAPAERPALPRTASQSAAGGGGGGGASGASPRPRQATGKERPPPTSYGEPYFFAQ